VDKVQVQGDRVVVRTRIEERQEAVEIPLRREELVVEHVPIGAVIEHPPPVREENGVLIIPIVEEQPVVTTRLVLKEEVRITRKQHVEAIREPVRLRMERAEITRFPANDIPHSEETP